MRLAPPGAMADPEDEEREGYVHWLVASSAGLSPAEVERRFDELIRARWRPREGAEVPADVYLVGRELWVEVDLPGVPESQVSVHVEAGELVIEARREIVPPAGGAPALRRERVPGKLRRRLRLPVVLRQPVLEVRCESGVLRVRIRPGGEGGE
jgi:HSP20 family molecular chaperone IbpA